MFTLRIHTILWVCWRRKESRHCQHSRIRSSSVSELCLWTGSSLREISYQQRPQFKMKYSTHLCFPLCYEDLCAEMSVLVYLQSCYYFQTPFTLTLRLWDIFILEGEKVLTAMAYTILQLHKSEFIFFTLLKLTIF